MTEEVESSQPAQTRSGWLKLGSGKLLDDLWRYHAPEILLLLLVPIALVLASKSWTFLGPTGTELDAYVNTGYFLDLRHYLQVFGKVYYASRIPWLVFGSLMYSAFSIELANLLIRLVLFYSATISLYVTVRWLWQSRPAAIVSALLLGTYSYFLFGIRHDYVPAPGYVAMFACLAFMAVAHRIRSPFSYPFWALAGSAAIVSLSLHLLQAVFLPVLGFWVLALCGFKWDKVLMATYTIVIGVIVTFTFFGLINQHLGGEFNYIKPQIDLIRSDEPTLFGASSDYSYLKQAGWDVFPLLSLVTSLALLAVSAITYQRQRRLSQTEWLYAFAAVQCLLAFLLFGYVDLTRGYVFRLYYYTGFILPFSFVAIGAGVARVFSGATLKPVTYAGIFAAVLLLLVVPMGINALHITPPSCTNNCLLDGRVGLAIAAAIVLLVAATWLRKPYVLIAAVALIGFINPALPPQWFWEDSVTDILEDRFVMVYDANDAVRPFDANGDLLFWYDYGEPMGGTFKAVSSLHLWGYRLLSDQFPALTSPLFQQEGKDTPISAGKPIAILTAKDDALAKAQATLGKQGLSAAPLATFRIAEGKESFNVVVVSTVPEGQEVPLTVTLPQFTKVLGDLGETPDHVVVVKTTDQQNYAFAAVYPLLGDVLTKAEGKQAFLYVRLKVDEGRVGLGTVSKDFSTFYDATEIGVSKGAVDVFLKVPPTPDGAFFVIRSLTARVTGKVEVQRAGLIIPSAAPAQ